MPATSARSGEATRARVPRRDEAVRPAGCPRRVHLRGAAGAAHRIPGSQRCRQDDRDACRVRPGRAGRRRRDAGGRAHRRRGARTRFGYMPEERGLYPRMRVREQLVYLGQLCGRHQQRGGAGRRPWLERLGVAGRATDRVDTLSHGNQQRVQLIAALVNEPDLLVLDEPFSGLDPIAMAAMAELLAELAGGRGDRAVLQPPARPRRGPVRGRRHHRPRPRRAAGDLDELRAAVPQRFVDVRYRGPAPDWSRLAAVQVVEANEGRARLRVDRDTDLGRGHGRRPAQRRGHLVRLPAADALGAVPPGGGGMTGVAARLAGRPPGDARAEPVRGFRAGLVVMLLVVIAMIVAPRAARHRGGTKDVGLTGAAPAELSARHPRARAMPSAPPCACTGTTTWPPGEQAVRDEDVDVLVVDARRLEWQGRADEQLQAVVTGAIQLVAVQQRAAAAGIDPDDLLRAGRPGAGRERRDRHGRRPRPRRRDRRDPDDGAAARWPSSSTGTWC